MIDRELLELAAKAAGDQLWAAEALPPGIATMNCGYWNPLHDDGDALRLAAKLNIWPVLHQNKKGDYIAVQPGSHYWDALASEVVGGDLRAAIRRAIVRAAAAIEQGFEA